jgi:hypothetical protein
MHAAQLSLVATRLGLAQFWCEMQLHGKVWERGTESPIGGIWSASLASLSMSGLPIVLTREYLHQVNDSATIWEVYRASE